MGSIFNVNGNPGLTAFFIAFLAYILFYYFGVTFILKLYFPTCRNKIYELKFCKLWKTTKHVNGNVILFQFSPSLFCK